jgi:MoxR-like ATPase
MSAGEKGCRVNEAVEHAKAFFGLCKVDRLREVLQSGYGKVSHKSAGCNFWAKRATGGCKHYKMVLGGLRQQTLDDLKAEWHSVMGDGEPEPSTDSEDKMMALSSSAFIAPVLVIGPPASGKTHSVRAFAESISGAYIEYGCHDGSESTDLLGFTVPYKGGWVWKDGPVSEGFRKAAAGTKVVLLLDELLRMPRQQRSGLLTAFGEYKGRYTLRTGRIVSECDGVGQEETLSCECKNLFLVGTTNAGAQYGIEDMDGALKSRFRIMYFSVSAQTISEALEAELGLKAWRESDKAWAKSKLTELMRKSELAAKSAALNAPLDMRAVKRIIASCAAKDGLERSAEGERLQCVGMSKDGGLIEEHGSFYAEMVKKVFGSP